MKGAESDELRRIEVGARQVTADALSRTAAALEAPLKEAARAELYVTRPPLHRLFGGERGAVVFLRSIPGFAGLWEKAVPDSFVREVEDRDRQRWQIVYCPCGEHPSLRPGSLAECPGGCERWFFSTGAGVRVHGFAEAVAA